MYRRALGEDPSDRAAYDALLNAHAAAGDWRCMVALLEAKLVAPETSADLDHVSEFQVAQSEAVIQSSILTEGGNLFKRIN